MARSIDRPNPPSNSEGAGESGTVQYGHVSDRDHGRDRHENDHDDRRALPCSLQWLAHSSITNKQAKSLVHTGLLVVGRLTRIVSWHSRTWRSYTEWHRPAGETAGRLGEWASVVHRGCHVHAGGRGGDSDRDCGRGGDCAHQFLHGSENESERENANDGPRWSSVVGWRGGYCWMEWPNRSDRSLPIERSP